MISPLHRRDFMMGAVAIAPFASSEAVAQTRDKKSFLALALKEIDTENARIEAERVQIERKGGKAPLFVRLPRALPFGDWDWYYIDGILSWAPSKGQKLVAVEVPRGFTTDLASVPRVFWSIFPPTGRYAYAAIVHDYLYWIQDGTRQEADEIFKAAMEDSNVDKASINTIYSAVRLGGGSAWDNNSRAKASGGKRILGKFPPDPLTSWATWSKTPGVFKD